MNKRPKNWLMVILAVAGVGLALLSLIELDHTPDLLQYCALPGGEKKTIVQLNKICERISENLGEASEGIAFSWVSSANKLTRQGRTADCTLYAIGDGWLDICPRFLQWGRRINEAELQNGGRVCMMDAGLAFQLFGDPLPENPRIDLLGHSYRLVGTVRHAGSLLGGRGVGDEAPYDLYLPLSAALRDGFAATVEMLTLAPAADTGVEPQFLQAAKNYWREGDSLINLSKEAMRTTILPRIAMLFNGIYVLGLLFRRMNWLAAWLRDGYREALRHSYARRLWPRLIGISLIHAVGYGALAALCGALAVFTVQPVYIFTEWVPENFVAWSSISKVFWNLTQTAAGLVRVGSRELRVIAFWGGALRWATVLLLTASALRSRRGLNLQKENSEP